MCAYAHAQVIPVLSFHQHLFVLSPRALHLRHHISRSTMTRPPLTHTSVPQLTPTQHTLPHVTSSNSPSHSPYTPIPFPIATTFLSTKTRPHTSLSEPSHPPHRSSHLISPAPHPRPFPPDTRRRSVSARSLSLTSHQHSATPQPYHPSSQPGMSWLRRGDFTCAPSRRPC